MTDVERLFLEVWNRLTVEWGRVSTFRQMALLGQDAARESIHRANVYFVRHRMLNGDMQSLLKDRDAFIAEGMATTVPDAMTEGAVRNFRSTLDAASLVFAHALLDEALLDCLKVCAAAGPEDWTDMVRKKTVSLSDVAEKTFKQLLSEAIAGELKRLERESLLTKADRLFAICRPAKSVFLTNGFTYDRERLLQLDEARHRAVHQPGAALALDPIWDALQFLQSTGLHLFSMVAFRFGLKVSGEAIELLLGGARDDAPPPASQA